MTTIAWDGKTLATDSQSNVGENKGGKHMKKLYRNVGPFQAVALTGEVRSFPLVLAAFKEGGSALEMAVEVGAICIDKMGVAWEFDGYHWSFEKMRPRTAHGSGWALATAAMEGGADAEKALRIACKLDIFSGGRIQKFTVPTEKA